MFIGKPYTNKAQNWPPMNPSSILKSIYQHPQLNSASVEEIIKAHKKVFFKKSEIILKQGQQSNAYYCME
tara:strand:+ start:29779 stop:29988 length:210 start_codon:yes stop_codon:yes gene_type:complete